MKPLEPLEIVISNHSIGLCCKVETLIQTFFLTLVGRIPEMMIFLNKPPSPPSTKPLAYSVNF